MGNKVANLFVVLGGLLAIVGVAFSLAFLAATPFKSTDRFVEGIIIDISQDGTVKIISHQHGFIFTTSVAQFSRQEIAQIGQCVMLQGRDFSYPLIKPQLIPKGGQIIEQICKTA